jgi:XapX domain-containing protein
MQPYAISLGAGLLAGVLYGLLGVRSPAPPAIALIGLLGILVGEQAVPLAKRLFEGRPVIACRKSDCITQVLGADAAARRQPPDLES